MRREKSVRLCMLAIAACGLFACSTPTHETEPASGASEAVARAAPTDSSQPAAQLPEPGKPDDSPTPSREPDGSPVHGYVSTRYRGRWTDGYHDSDVYSVLALDVGDPSKDHVTGHVMAQAAADLDGNSGAADPFYSLNDTSGNEVTTRLYRAFADVKPDLQGKSTIERLRVGRQLDYSTPEFAWFDGASAQTQELGSQRMQVGVYGGVPVHLYDTSTSGNRVFGAFGQSHPAKNTRVR